MTRQQDDSAAAIAEGSAHPTRSVGVPDPTRSVGVPGSIAQAIAQLESQAGLAEELADLARGQAELIAHGEADQLLAVLEKRQDLIDELLSIVESMTPLTEMIQRTPGAASSAERSRVRSLVDAIGGRLAEVIEIDSTDRARLQKRLSEIQKEIGTNGAARSAQRAYRRSNAAAGTPISAGDPRFTDQKG